MTTINIMLDLETLSTAPNAAVFSLAAVQFDPMTLDTPDTVRQLESFMVNFTFESVLEKGMRVDGSTLTFWWDQPAEYREFYLAGRMHVERGMEMLWDWFAKLLMEVKGESKFVMWAMGTDFEGRIFDNLTKSCYRQVPWKYTNKMDVRSICKFAGVDRKKEIPELPYHNHHPLVDCWRQVLLVQECYSNTRRALDASV